MLEIICGGLVGAGITALLFADRIRVMRKYVEETRRAYGLLRETSENQLREYWEFRRKFEEYRARFDPIDTTRDGNVITIKRGKHE